jgi:hypothetical protein
MIFLASRPVLRILTTCNLAKTHYDHNNYDTMDRVTLGLRQIFIEDTRNDTKEETKKFE